MSQKVREIVTIVFGFISGVNAIYQLLFRQDIALFIVNAIVAGIAFYTWVNRDNPEQLKKMNRGGAVILDLDSRFHRFWGYYESFWV